MQNITVLTNETYPPTSSATLFLNTPPSTVMFVLCVPPRTAPLSLHLLFTNTFPSPATMTEECSPRYTTPASPKSALLDSKVEFLKMTVGPGLSLSPDERAITPPFEVADMFERK